MTLTSVTFRYTALLPSGERCSGVVRAPDAGQARARLAAMGTLPLAVAPVQSRATERGLSGLDSALGLRLLADLMAAGLSLEGAIGALETLAPAAWKDALPDLLQAIREGETLGTALSQMSRPLDSTLLGIVQAGESSGTLAQSLCRAAAYAEARQARVSSLRSALAYPAVVLTVGVLTLGTLILVVIPRFGALLIDMGASVPRGFGILLGGADLLRAYGIPAGVAAVALLALADRLLRAPGRRRWCQRMLLSAPLIGPISRALLDARLLETIGAAVEAGVPLRRALAISIDAERHLELRHRLQAAREAVLEGQSLGVAFQRFDVIAPTALTLVSAGERTGRVAAFCLRAATVQAEDGERRIRAVLRLLEPGLILALALIVGLVSSALLQAVYAIRP